jgi:RNA polymerase sigma factor (TIGR02999 family)
MVPSPARQEVTQVLLSWNERDANAAERLMPLVYDELRRLARSYLQRERSDHTLQATGLVHEAYLRLVDQSTTSWQNRAHFFSVAAQVMRRILVDHARARQAAKRGGVREKLQFDEEIAAAEERAVDLISLDDALQNLVTFDDRKSRIVELRFFGGLTIEEIAEVLEISPRTIRREWRLAKAWLRREIMKGESLDAAIG